MQIATLGDSIPSRFQSYSFKRFVANTVISAWKIFWIPLMLGSHVQLILLPWSIVNNRFAFGSISSLGSLEIFKHYPITTTNFLQLLWTPVICSVEEISYEFALQNLNLNGAILWVHQFLKVFTMCLQCVVAVVVYAFLILISICRHHLVF
jgi:hypothetical protein